VSSVLVDGKRVLSCLTLAAQCEGREVTMIEGLASDDKEHPLQAAVVPNDALPCYSAPCSNHVGPGDAGRTEHIPAAPNRGWRVAAVTRCGLSRCAALNLAATLS
jgi:hypothetical protein